jgi:hypothetical protein
MGVRREIIAQPRSELTAEANERRVRARIVEAEDGVVGEPDGGRVEVVGGLDVVEHGGGLHGGEDVGRRLKKKRREERVVERGGRTLQTIVSAEPDKRHLQPSLISVETTRPWRTLTRASGDNKRVDVWSLSPVTRCGGREGPEGEETEEGGGGEGSGGLGSLSASPPRVYTARCGQRAWPRGTSRQPMAAMDD